MKLKLALLLSFAALQIAPAAMIFTTEAAGVQQTSLTNTLTESFNLLPSGALGAYKSAIGSYSAGGSIVKANAFGGANQSRYISVGAQSSTTSYTLTFAEEQSYFGLNWQAGDSRNELRFLHNGVLVQAFKTTSVFAGLPSSYNGNPNTGQNTREKYAFFNFFATGSTRFDQVVFYNYGTGTGFETDNHTIMAPRDPETPTVETTPTPEPATYALVGAVLIGLACHRRRHTTVK